MHWKTLSYNRFNPPIELSVVFDFTITVWSKKSFAAWLLPSTVDDMFHDYVLILATKLLMRYYLAASRLTFDDWRDTFTHSIFHTDVSQGSNPRVTRNLIAEWSPINQQQSKSVRFKLGTCLQPFPALYRKIRFLL